MDYKINISPKMQAVSTELTNAFVGMSHCITDTGRNLIVEVPKSMCESVRTLLKQSFQDVSLIRNAYPMIEDLHDFILVKPIISESPVFEENNVSVPELEKLLVDHNSDKEYAGKKEEIRNRMERIDRHRVATVHTIQDFFRQVPVRRAWIFGAFFQNGGKT